MYEIPPDNIVVMEDFFVGLRRTLATDSRTDSRTVHVYWSQSERNLVYTIYYSENNIEGEWTQRGPDTQNQISEFQKRLDRILDDAIKRGNPSDEVWQSICLSIKNIGERLFQRLIPHEVIERVRSWQPGTLVRISTNEQWIPWEIMHDGEDFLGSKYVVTRLPRLGERRTVPTSSRPNVNGNKHIKNGGKHVRKIVNVVGGGIPDHQAQQAAQLFRECPQSVSLETIQGKPISVLAEALVEADIFHCTCHGHQSPNHLLQISTDDAPTQNLSLDTIYNLSLTPGNFVFINACASSVPIEILGQFNNFGWEFYRQGTSVFIGTLGTVPVQYAINFAENVYRELFKEQSKVNVSQAIARAKAISAGERNVFWLLYCVYGDADLSF